MATIDWPSGYGPPPEPPPRDYSHSSLTTMKPFEVQSDDRLKNRFEACRSGMQELDALRAKHSLMIQNLRSRLPVIPGCFDDVQTRNKKNARDVFLDRFSLQSVDSGISSQNTMNSTRSSSPDDFLQSFKIQNNRHSNIYENSTSTTMNYSTFRKLSLETNNNNNINININNIKNRNQINSSSTSMLIEPPIITSRSCHRGAWKTSPKKDRPKSMFDTSTPNEFSVEKPPKCPINLSSNERRSAFSKIAQSSTRKCSAAADPILSLSQISLNEEAKMRQKPIRSVHKPEFVKIAKVEKADKMFRANVVYLSSPEQSIRSAAFRFSPSRSPTVRRAQVADSSMSQSKCQIRSPNINRTNVFAAKPICVRPTNSPKVAHHSTWLQSQPL